MTRRRPRRRARKLGAGAARAAGPEGAHRRDRPAADGRRSPASTFVQGDFREDDGLAAVEAALDGRKVGPCGFGPGPQSVGYRVCRPGTSVHLGELALEFAVQLAATRRRSGRQGVPGRRVSGVPAGDAAAFRQGLRAQAEGVARPQPRGLPGRASGCAAKQRMDCRRREAR